MYTGSVSTTRALVYAFMSGANNHLVNEVQFSAACNRFGVENPSPTIKKRLALYGNTEEVEKLLK